MAPPITPWCSERTSCPAPDAEFTAPVAAAVQAVPFGATIVNLGQSAGPTAELASAAVRFKNLSLLGHTNFSVPPDELADVQLSELRRALVELARRFEGDAVRYEEDLAWRDAPVANRIADRLGSVEAGKLADLLLVEGDPLKDISNMRRVKRVMLNGQWNETKPEAK